MNEQLQTHQSAEFAYGQAHGVFYPRHHVVAVFDTEAEADQAVAALRAAGFAADDLHTGPAAAVLHEQLEQIRPAGWQSLFQRISGALAVIEREEAAVYERAAAHGEPLMAVYATTPEQVETARATLRACGGRGVRYYDHWTIADLA